MEHPNCEKQDKPDDPEESSSPAVDDETSEEGREQEQRQSSVPSNKDKREELAAFALKAMEYLGEKRVPAHDTHQQVATPTTNLPESLATEESYSNPSPPCLVQ